MPELADAFNSDIYGLVSLTKEVNKMAKTPTHLGDMGIFREEGIKTKTVMIEEKNRRIAIIPESKRGAPGTPVSQGQRTGRTIPCGHIKEVDRIEADDLIGVRAFGSESDTETMDEAIAEELVFLRELVDVTREYRRVGAIHGQILDADGTTVLVNLFTEFGVSETTVDFKFSDATTDILGRLKTMKRAGEIAIGRTARIRGWHGIAGKNWFDAYTNHAKVRDTYANWSSNEMLRTDKRAGFPFGGVTVMEYNETVSGNDFVDDDQCRFFADADIYAEYFAPADYTETVNTVGLPNYAKSELTKFNKGVDMEAQSNPLPLCFFPASLIKGTTS